MNVVTVWHDGDFLCVAKDYHSAIIFLINQRYIDGSDEILVDEPNKYCRLDEYLGEDWADIMTYKWTIHRFNIFYDYWFEIQENYVYDYQPI